MISEEDLSKQENIPYEERITRVEKLLEGKEKPRAFELGLLLALKMGQEIREKKPLGSMTASLVAKWSQNYPPSIVEEAISSAKEFLTNPTKLTERIKKSMLSASENKPIDNKKNDEANNAE